jgi:hypothetical protein
MAIITRWIQRTVDRLKRPLAFLAVALFLLALHRSER